MADNLLSSTGKAGDIERRIPSGRTYLTSNSPISNPVTLMSEWQRVLVAMNENGDRRAVYRTRATREAIERVEAEGGLHFSVNLPLERLGIPTTDGLVTAEHNIHLSDVPEWGPVYEYWKNPKEYKEPVEQIDNLPARYQLTNSFSNEDRTTLLELWKPFGWTEKKIDAFLQTYRENNALWISGVRDENGQLASACMGEALVFDGIYMVEATEFGTRMDLRGKNLSTAAVVGLIAQVIQKAEYEEGHTPLIIAEFNMEESSRSDVVGRKAGFTIAGVEGIDGLLEPTQVLRRNVAVLDSGRPNGLSFAAMSNDGTIDRDRHRDAFRDRYCFWRNFIVGMMTKEKIDNDYSPEKVRRILDRFTN